LNINKITLVSLLFLAILFAAPSYAIDTYCNDRAEIEPWTRWSLKGTKAANVSFDNVLKAVTEEIGPTIRLINQHPIITSTEAITKKIGKKPTKTQKILQLDTMTWDIPSEDTTVRIKVTLWKGCINELLIANFLEPTLLYKRKTTLTTEP